MSNECTQQDSGDCAATPDTSTMAGDPSILEHPRYREMFPVLTDLEVDRLRRFGSLTHHVEGEMLYRAGKISPGMFVLLSGRVHLNFRDGLGHQRTFITYSRRGEFTSDVAQLSKKAALFDACVVENVEALLVRSDQLSAMMVGEAELGEKIMRALILRRTLAIERGRGAVLVGDITHPRLLALQTFLSRNSFPSVMLDARHDTEAIAQLERLTLQPGDFPLVFCPNGTVLRNPDEVQLAACLELIPEFDPTFLYDVAIVGAGPAGLAAAVYAASEGLSVAVLECRAPGGQAGTSARIENYLGFPTGITGQSLAGRAFNQAQKFGANIGISCEVAALYCDQQPLVVELTDGRRISARTVVIASGAEYRRPNVDDLVRFERCGVYYWATPLEAKLCAAEPVLLLGGGNSAGQAAVYLASQVEHVHMFIRGVSLEQSMSRYLIERVNSLSNVTLHTRAELTKLEGDTHLERVRYRGAGGMEGILTAHHLFVFIGADPNTAWLKTCGVSVDSKGFVLTDTDIADSNTRRLPFQTSIEGVFAIGDVRSGSTKRVASAVGEGAGVVAQIHRFLAGAR